MSYSISAMRPEELAFVAGATKSSLRHGELFAAETNHAAYALLNPAINRLVREYEVLVARRGGLILGFVIFDAAPEVLTVGFAYVRHAERRAGVAKALLARVLDRYPGEVYLEHLYPTVRFAETAERYGFFLSPDALPIPKTAKDSK